MGLCIFLSTNPPKKMVFAVKAEEYAEFVLKGSQALGLSNTSEPTYTWASVSQEAPAPPLNCTHNTDIDARGHLVSCPQIYMTATHAVHVMSLVINLRDGEISSFAWDNGCAGCGPNSCIRSSKAIDVHRRKISANTF